MVTEWALRLLHMLEDLVSRLGSETISPNFGFSWLSSVPPGRCQDSTSNFITKAEMQSLVHLVHPTLPSLIFGRSQDGSLNALFSVRHYLEVNSVYMWNASCIKHIWVINIRSTSFSLPPHIYIQASLTYVRAGSCCVLIVLVKE